MDDVSVLPDRFIPSLTKTRLIFLYIILLSFIKIGHFFEIIKVKTHTQTHRQTDRHIHSDENNTCQKNKVFGPGNDNNIFTDPSIAKLSHTMFTYFFLRTSKSKNPFTILIENL